MVSTSTHDKGVLELDTGGGQVDLQIMEARKSHNGRSSRVFNKAGHGCAHL
jgi:hypothetical protein